MKNDPDRGDLDPAERRERIVTLIRSRGFVRVRELASELAVSEVTIRQDLRGLEELGELRRVRGGACVVQTHRRASGGEQLAEPAVDVMGAMVAAFVRSGDRIVLDSAPEIRAVAEALVGRADLVGVTVYTESLRALPVFAGHLDRFTVVVPPGSLSGSLCVRPDRDDADFSADLAVLGSAGITVDGVFAHSEPEASTRRRAALAARRSIVLVSPDVGHEPGTHIACSLERVNACVTVGRLPAAVAVPLRATGLLVFAAS